MSNTHSTNAQMCQQVNPDLHAHTRLPLSTHLIVLFGYLLLSIALTWPLILHMDAGIIGHRHGFEDGSQNVWNMWWVRSALEHGQNPFWSDKLYYPEGVQMYVQTLNLPAALLALPLQYLAGPVVAFNSAILLAMCLTGYGGYALVRTFVSARTIPFICGTLLTACPFHIFILQLNQLNLISMQWLPFYFLALYRMERRNSGTLVAVLLFLLIVLTDWYWALVCSIYTLIWFVISVVRTQERGQLLCKYSLFGGGVVLCSFPLLLGLLHIREKIPRVDIQQDEIWNIYIRVYSVDVLGLFYPTIYHPLLGESMQTLLAPIRTRVLLFESGYITAGWILLVCAGVGIYHGWRQHWPLLVVGTAMWLLALGPTLQIAGIETGIPLPYRWVQHMPLFSTARRPGLFAVPVIILATIFAGIGLQAITQRLRPRWQTIFLCSVALLAAFELWPPTERSVFRFESHHLFEYLRERPGAVADLPLERHETSRSLRNQLIHEQPILGGYVARRPLYHTLNIPLLNQMGRMQHRPDIVPVSPEALRAMQCYHPVRHVVVDKHEETPGSLRELRSLLTTLTGATPSASYDDAQYVWYELPLFEDQCQPFVYLGQGWYDVEQNDELIWRWASATNDLWLVNPFAEPIIAHVTMTAEGFETARPIEVWQDDRRIADWEVARARRPYQWLVHLPPGTHRLQVRADTSIDPVRNRPQSISVLELQIQGYTRLRTED